MTEMVGLGVLWPLLVASSRPSHSFSSLSLLCNHGQSARLEVFAGCDAFNMKQYGFKSNKKNVSS